MTYKEIEKDVAVKIEVAVVENMEKYSNGVSTIAEYNYYDELLKVNSRKWISNVRDLPKLA